MELCKDNGKILICFVMYSHCRCRNFRSHERARYASDLLLTTRLLPKPQNSANISVCSSRSPFGSRGRPWERPCPRPTPSHMLRQLSKGARRLQAVSFNPYGTLKQAYVLDLLHQDLNKSFSTTMKQSNLGAFFGAKNKLGDGKVRINTFAQSIRTSVA